MSLQVFGKRTFITTVEDTLNATGPSLIYYSPTPIDITRWGYVLSSALTGGSFAATLSVGTTNDNETVRQTMSAVGNKADGDVIFVDAILPVAEAAGEDTLTGGVTPQTSRINVGPAGPVHVRAGGFVSIDVTVAAGSAGTAFAFIEYVPYDTDGVEPNVFRVTGTP